MKRRNAIIGMGTLALGSGATLTSASFSNTTSADSTLEVYSVGELNVGIGNTEEYGETYTIDSASDLPAAHVSGNTQSSDLTVEVATRNSSSQEDFTDLLTVSNDGTESVDVGISFTSFGTEVGDTGDGSNISEDEVIDAYTFEVESTEISPTSDTPTEPANYVNINSGTEISVDLSVNLSGTLVSQINDVTAQGQSFTDSNTEGVTLVDEITFGTDGS